MRWFPPGPSVAVTLGLGLLVASACGGHSVGLEKDASVVPPGDGTAATPDGAVVAPDADVPTTCGNGVCDPDETALDCATECAAHSVAAGEYHSCAALADTSATCWGFNRYGQLGDGTRDDAAGRVRVSNLWGVNTVTAGMSHSCALLEDGAAWCWGHNTYGQLGAADAVEQAPLPIRVTGLDAAVAISAGRNHSCAVQADRTAWCWGANGSGQLGDGTTTDHGQPVRVLELQGVVSLAAGGQHTCARLEDASTWCWGRNHRGQLGNGAAEEGPFPGLVATVGSAAALTAGEAHTCARLLDGETWCWGENEQGQLGQASPLWSQLPLRLGASWVIAQPTGGADQTCAVIADGAVRCWGAASVDGAVTVGDGLAIGPLPAAASLAVGTDHACAIATGGSLWCWGSNPLGQLGDLYLHDSQQPVLVRGR